MDLYFSVIIFIKYRVYPIIPALFLILFPSYYSKNYSSIMCACLMVGQQHVQVEWQSTYSEGYRSGDQLRCIPGGMGGLLLQVENRGPWSQ